MKISTIILIISAIIVSFILFNLFVKKPYSAEFEDVRRVCCAECLSAFSQSPVGVGPQAARCGEFTSAYDISEECGAYFKTNPMTVVGCQELT